MILNVEELSMNAFPALSTLLVNGWILRFSKGYAKRANSVNPIYPCTIDVQKNIEICENMYQSRGQATVFKLTEEPEACKIDEILNTRGYAYEAKTIVMGRTVKGFQINQEEQQNVKIYRELREDWFKAFAVMNKVREENVDTLRKMLHAINADTYYACIMEGEMIAAVGLAVAERGYAGMFDICVHPDARRRGLATKLMRNLMHAVEQDSEYSYLQVVDDNEPAKQLYHKLGYEKLYSYWYRVKRIEETE